MGIRSAMALALGMFAGVPCAQAAVFGAVSQETQHADSGWQVAYAHVFQQYTEYAPTGSSFPYGPVVDSENGGLQGGSLGYRHESAHLGYGVVATDTQGATSYQGYTQDPLTATYTPLAAQTRNHLADLKGWVNYAFAPSALPNLAILPGMEIGDNRWDRFTSDGDHETYNSFYGAGRLVLEHAMGPVVLALSAAVGRTLHPTVTATLVHHTFVLGAQDWLQYQVRLTYNVTRYASVFASYTETRYRFGRSATANGVYEPASLTRQGLAEAGVLMRGW